MVDRWEGRYVLLSFLVVIVMTSLIWFIFDASNLVTCFWMAQIWPVVFGWIRVWSFVLGWLQVWLVALG